MAMSAGDLATLSLLDPDQGACPEGHRCQFDAVPGFRTCATCDYRGLALICWDITSYAIDEAERAGATRDVVSWARDFIGERGSG